MTEVEHTEIQKGWNAFIDHAPYDANQSDEWKRGYVSADLTGARQYIKPHQQDWLAEREADAQEIKNLKEEVKILHRENKLLSLRTVILAVINIAIAVTAFGLGVWIESL